MVSSDKVEEWCTFIKFLTFDLSKCWLEFSDHWWEYLLDPHLKVTKVTLGLRRYVLLQSAMYAIQIKFSTLQ